MDLSMFSGLKSVLDQKAPNLMVVGTVAVVMYAVYAKMTKNLEAQTGELSGTDKLRMGAGSLVAGGVILGVAFPDWRKGGGGMGGLGVIKKCPPHLLDPKRPADDQVWCLMNKTGERLMGRHATREGAERQERGIHIWKRRR